MQDHGPAAAVFESDVVSNRSQTAPLEPRMLPLFESDVVSNRSQTAHKGANCGD